MSTEKLKTIGIYFLILVALVLQNTIKQEIILLILWIFIAIINISLKDVNNRFRAETEKVKLVVIIIVFYYILYLLIGLITGYKNSPYSLKINEIIKNIVFIVFFISIQEFVRSQLLNQSKSKISYVIVTLLFAALRISFQNINENFTDLEAMSKYILIELIPITIESILLSYLSLNGGYVLNYAYTIPKNLGNILIPVFPNVDWFMDITTQYVRNLLIFLLVSYEHVIQVKRDHKSQIRKENPAKTIPTILIIIVGIAFVSRIVSLQTSCRCI